MEVVDMELEVEVVDVDILDQVRGKLALHPIVIMVEERMML